MDDLDFIQDEQTTQYIKRKGVYLIKVLEFENSKNKEGYNKTHFIKFKVEDEVTGNKTNLLFWMPKQGESPERTALKKKLIKEFLENLGCNLGQMKGDDLLACSVGKMCKVALREKERVYFGKQDGKPMIITEMDYYYSGKPDATLTANESKMFLPLTPTMRADYEAALAAWKKEHEPQTPQGDSGDTVSAYGTFNNTSSADDDDDFPF